MEGEGERTGTPTRPHSGATTAGQGKTPIPGVGQGPYPPLDVPPSFPGDMQRMTQLQPSRSQVHTLVLLL